MILKNIQCKILKDYDVSVEKRIKNWEVGIGLNEVDNLTLSRYLVELTKLEKYNF